MSQFKSFTIQQAKEDMMSRHNNLSHQTVDQTERCYNWDSMKDCLDDCNEDNHEYVLFAGCQKRGWQSLPDIDLMDLPINGSSVSLDGAISMGHQQVRRLPIQSFKGSKLMVSKCAFCEQRVNTGDRIVELPCKHTLHFACIKKWTFIPNPCRKCNHK